MAGQSTRIVPKNLRSCLIASVLLVLFALPVFAGEGGCAGWKSCAGCHDDIAAKWQKSRHAKAFESLRKTNQQNLPRCISCHVTGYEQPGGFIDDELTPELSGVQCEACHGEGKAHAEGSGKTGLRKTPPVEVCRRCHTPAQDPNFDYGKKIQKIHETGANGKAVKK